MPPNINKNTIVTENILQTKSMLIFFECHGNTCFKIFCLISVVVNIALGIHITVHLSLLFIFVRFVFLKMVSVAFTYFLPSDSFI